MALLLFSIAFASRIGKKFQIVIGSDVPIFTLQSSKSLVNKNFVAHSISWGWKAKILSNTITSFGSQWNVLIRFNVYLNVLIFQWDQKLNAM